MLTWLGLHLHSMKARFKLLACDDNTHSAHVFCTPSADDDNEALLQKCLSDPTSAPSIVKEARNTLYLQNWDITIQRAN